MYKLFYIFLCLCGIMTGLTSCDLFKSLQEETNHEITVYGNIADGSTGQPIYNANVEVWFISEYNEDAGTLSRTVTGSDGNYEFNFIVDNAKKGDYFLVASKEQYESSTYAVNIENAKRTKRVKIDCSLKVYIAPEDAQIMYSGRVVDTDGYPIEGALVEETKHNSGSTYTDANGNYSFQVPPPPVEKYQYINYATNIIRVWKSGYREEKKEMIFYEKDYNPNKSQSFTLNFTLSQNY